MKRTPSSISTSSTAGLTAVSGSQIPSERRPKRASKSRRPQHTWVRTSSGAARGRITWW